MSTPARTCPRPIDVLPVRVKLPRCPACASRQVRAYHTLSERDACDGNAITQRRQHTECDACGHRFLVIAE